MKPWISKCLGVALTAIAVGGCATQARLGQFKAFAEAGGAYQDTMSVVLDNYASSEIERNNAVLIDARLRLKTEPEPCVLSETAAASDGSGAAPGNAGDQADEDRLSPRQCQLFTFDAELKHLVATLSDLRRQAQLLKRYFAALDALAAYDGDSKIGEALTGTVKAIGDLSKSLKDAKIGTAKVSDLVGPIGTMIVGAYRRAALEQELKNSSARIDEALRTQAAVLSKLGDELANSQQAQLERSYFTSVVDPYGGKANTLPANWGAARKAYLLTTTDVEVVRNAAGAADTLHLAFVALVEGRADVDYIASVAQETSELLGLVVKIRGTPTAPPAQ